MCCPFSGKLRIGTGMLRTIGEYDMRNHGFSGAANGGIASSGIFKALEGVTPSAYRRNMNSGI
jgi:hypothetical protein